VASLKLQRPARAKIPGSAKVLDGEQSFVYRQLEAERFERIRVIPEQNQPRVGEAIVDNGAQILLAEERKASLQVLEGEKE
jgi:hypothetical protein